MFKFISLFLVSLVCVVGQTKALTIEEESKNLLVTTLGFDIIKQLEKLKYDKGDIKETDLYKFKIVCEDKTFLETHKTILNEKFRNDVETGCDIILSL